MDEARELPSQEQEHLTGDVMDSLGVDTDAVTESQDAGTAKDEKDDLPLAAKERLGRQEKRHRKEIRAMQEQLAQMNARLGHQQPTQDYAPQMDSFANQPNQPMGNQDQIQQAVMMALRAREEQERKVKEQEKLAHVQMQYKALQDHLDNAGDEHEDFDEVVRSPDAPFTESMRDTAMLMHKSGVIKASDLLYKLGKNKEELRRISQLHPLDQASEMMKLGFAMVNGGDKSTPSAPRTIGQIKTNPIISSNNVTDKTSVSELRKRMKAGWK